MKYVYMVVWLLLILNLKSIIFAQNSTELWTKTYGLENSDQGRHILPNEDGGYTFLGILENTETNSQDMWLVKLDSSGNIIWQEIYGGGQSDIGNRMVTDSKGGYLLSGYTRSYGAGEFDGWLVKVNSSGIPEWQKTYGDVLDDYIFSAIPASDEGYVLAGAKMSPSNEHLDFWVFQVDSMGNLGWETIIGRDDHDQARSIIKSSEGGYLVSGNGVTELGEPSDIWLVKLDSNGDSLWSKSYSGEYRDESYSVLEMENNNIMIVGYKTIYEGNRDIWILITDPDGNLINSSTYGGSAHDFGHSLNPTNDGNYIITGYTESIGSDGLDLLMFKFDNEGKEIWSETFGGSQDDYGQYIYEDIYGRYICIGITESFGAGGSDVWVIVTDSTGIYSPVPNIISISDIPNDQGGWVNIEFYRSSYDTDSLNLPKSGSTELYTVEINDGSGWMAAANTTAYGKSVYTVLVPTTRDSSSEDDGMIDFRIIASMEEGNFVSNVVSGYSVDNLKPAVPSGVGGTISGDSEIILSWDPNSENDLDHYTIYRSENESSFENIDQTTVTVYTDADIQTEVNYSYAISATDHSGNESGLSEKVIISITDIENKSSLPLKYYLLQNYPNPFNPVTTIKYGILNSGDVNVMIYDVLGNTVKELVNIKQSKGHYQVIWNGKNIQNKPVSSGIYYYQLLTKDFQQFKKMILVR